MMGALLRVDMTKMEVRREPNQYEEPLQGRSLVGRIMQAEVNPECEPLGRNNKLVLTTGPFAAAGVPCAGRLSVGGKSPLTGGIKEANSGGVLATKLGRLEACSKMPPKKGRRGWRRADFQFRAGESCQSGNFTIEIWRKAYYD